MPKLTGVTLKNEKIIDDWSILIEGAQGRELELYQKAEKFISENNAPGVQVDRVSVKPSWLKGLFGKERLFVRVLNEGMKDFRMYIGARDYGKNLDISWWMTCEPGFFKKRFSKLLTSGATDKAISYNLDLFDQQDLRAYATVVHHAVLDAAKEISESVDFDFSKVDQKSRGFLNIS